MSQPPWVPPQQPAPDPWRLSAGWGALLGVVLGFLGPVIMAVLTSLVSRLVDNGNPVIAGGIILIMVLPLVLMALGIILAIPDSTRGWGVAGMVASGVWLITSAGVCVAALGGAFG